VRAALPGFRPLPHRLEPAGSLGGVTFVNDSKGTNTEATRKAMESFSGGVHLILGGLDKGGDWEGLREVAAARTSGLYVIGAARERIAAALEGCVPLEEFATLEQAVAAAASRARPGETVLLSPGCASFDMFGGYEERGLAFCEAVRAWIEEQQGA
jgi:UDP-N-acetylmuramoylalanine--D-glutamate ligase